MSFRFALCSEVYKLPIEETIRRVADIGFDGIEIAPFLIADNVEDISSARRREIARAAESAGIRIVGLHWLLLTPEGLHLTTPDKTVRQRTTRYLQALVDFCADLGGEVLILGSPKQRNLAEGEDLQSAMERAAESLRTVGETCAERGPRLLIEALNPAETNFLKTVEEAIELRDLVGNPQVGYMLDCKAMSGMPEGIVGTIRRHGKSAGHFHSNEPGGLGPGMGEVDFGPILTALEESGFQGWVSCEPFNYEPDPETVARRALETLRAASP